MRHLLYIIVSTFYIIAPSGNAQVIFQGKILDGSNGSELAYANIGIQGTLVGDVSNEFGDFKITVPDSLMDSNISFSYVGFADTSFSISSLLKQNHLVIRLKPSSIQLDLIEISASRKGVKFEKYNINQNLAKHGAISLSKAEYGGAAVATYFEVDHDTFWITNAAVSIAENYSGECRLRLRVFSQDDHGNIGTELTQINYVQSFNSNGWLTFNLGSEPITMYSRSFYIVFELIETFEKRSEIESKRQHKSKMMHELWQQGIKGIEPVYHTVNDNREIKGWRTTLSNKKMKKFGIDFPVGSVSFAVTQDDQHPGFTRRSSFDEWRPLLKDQEVECVPMRIGIFYDAE